LVTERAARLKKFLACRIAGWLARYAELDMPTVCGCRLSAEERLFDANYTTKDEGPGLGLSIHRKVVAVHGGCLWVEESTSLGATFTSTVPLRQSVRISESN